MTALCGGGSSGVQSTVSNIFTFSASSVEAFLISLGIEAISASILAPIIAIAARIDLANYCATDPPADPGLTAQDVIDAINVAVPSVHIPAAAKVVTWFESQYWYKVCECTSTTTPSPPSISNPGPASNNPGLPTAPANNPCWSASASVTDPVRHSAGVPHWSSVPDLVPNPVTGNVLAPGSSLDHTDYHAFPNGLTSVQWTDTVDSIPSSGTVTGMQIGVLDSSLARLASITMSSWTSSSVGLSQQGYFTAIPTGARWLVPESNNSDTVTHSHDIHVDFYCNGQGPSGLAAACCPPDPLLQGMLSQILALTQAIYSIIPVRVPTYVAGTPTGGLTGNGTVSIASTTIAVQAIVTTLPAVYGQISGSPDTFIDIGWVTPVTAYGPEAGYKLSRTEQVIALPEATTSLDYSLPPGEVISITQLQAG